MATNSQIAFAPFGKTIVAAAAGVQAPVAPQFDAQNVGQYRVINSGSSIVFLGVGATQALAVANAVAPVAGTPSNAVVLLPGAVEILRFNKTAFFSGSASVYITPGQGL